nr:hypothetical protein [Tanacetum cinerariifolium]
DKENEAEHDQLKVNKEKLEVDFVRAIKAKHDKEKGKVHDLDLNDLDVDIDDRNLDDRDLENRIKMLELDFGRILKAKQAKQAKQAIKDLVLFNDVKYPLTDAEIMMFKVRPTRQVAFTSTFNAQAASTSAPKGYRKIAMTGCVLGLRAPHDPNASKKGSPRNLD